MKKGLITICLCSCLLLSGCGDKKTSGSIEEVKKNKNTVTCTTTYKLNYNDVDSLKNVDATSIEEYLEKKEIETGTYTKEQIFEFNKEGNKIEKVYQIVTKNYTHEDVTEDLLKTYKEYLKNRYKDDENYLNYKITTAGKKIVLELTINMDKVENKDRLNMTKEQTVYMFSMSSKDGKKTECKID